MGAASRLPSLRRLRPGKPQHAALLKEHAALQQAYERVAAENASLRQQLKDDTGADDGSAKLLSDLRVKHATVRLGLLSTDTGRFFELGSGVGIGGITAAGLAWDVLLKLVGIY